MVVSLGRERNADEAWPKHTDNAVNHSRTHAVITVREGGGARGTRARLQLLQINRRNVSVQQRGPLSLSLSFLILFFSEMGVAPQISLQTSITEGITLFMLVKTPV